MELNSKITLFSDGSYEILVEESKGSGVFVEVSQDELKQMAKKYAESSKKKKEEPKKKKEKEEKSSKSFKELYDEAQAKARLMESDVGYGAGQEYLDEWEKKNKKKLDAYIKLLKKSVKK